MNVLVFGSNGYIGSRLVTALRVEGHTVLAESSRTATGAVDPQEGILRTGYKIPNEIEVVYYLSQSPYYRELPRQIGHVMAVNCLTPYRLAALAAAAGVRNFVYTSTGSVYEPSFSPLNEHSRLCCSDLYALSKIAAEKSLGAEVGATKVSCTRLFGVYGPDQPGKMVHSLCQRLLQGQKIFLERDPMNGSHSGLRMSMTYVADLVTALIALAELDCPPPVVNVAGQEALSIRDIVISLASELGVPPQFECLDRDIRGYYLADTALLQQFINLDTTPLAKGVAACCAAL